jgi:hypothetical protein
MSKVRIFDPTGIKAEDYRHRYPELERTEEFSGFTPKALIFIWWYANATSDLVLYMEDDYERAKEALRRSGYNPTKTEKERILDLRFDSNMAVAIKKMGSYDPGARFKAFLMIKKIYDQYQSIIDLGMEAFEIETTTGKGENQVTSRETDYKKYVDVTTKIAEAMPGLLAKLEEGFAITTVTGDEVIAGEENSDLRDWHTKKEE